jgi:catecholate siderophore receptor
MADEAADQRDGDSIIVIGTSQGYVATNSVTATKTDTPLKDIPQTISVVTREQIEDQAHRSLSDVLRYVPGVTVAQGEGNRDQITLRGQNTTADFFLDGVRDDVQYYRSLYNLERVEVLKGPYAMIFGRGGGGGIINRVQKTPQAAAHVRGAAGVNTFGGFDISADISQPLTENAAIRLNAFYEKLESHRDFVDGERYAINPYVAADLRGWKLGLSYEYVNDDRVPDRGVPSVECAPAATCIRRPLGGNRDTFFGLPGSTAPRSKRISARCGSTANWPRGSTGRAPRSTATMTNITPTSIRTARYGGLTARSNWTGIATIPTART